MPLLTKKHCWQCLLFSGSILLFAQCKKPEEPNSGPSWFKKDASYFYDLDSAGLLKEQFLTLTIRDNREEGIYISEDVHFPVRQRPYPSLLVDLPATELYRGAAGLFGAYYSCGFSWGNDETPYLLVPADPVKGQTLALYGCSGTILGTDSIATTNETIQVPAGSFTTFSIIHHNGDRSWWNVEKGIVQYQTYLLDPDSNKVPVLLRLHTVTNL